MAQKLKFVRRKVDANHAEIICGLRQMGCSVLDLHTLGKGCPDILVAYRGVEQLMEIKSGEGKLTRQEKDFHELWRGHAVVTVFSLDEAFARIQELAEFPWAGANR